MHVVSPEGPSEWNGALPEVDDETTRPKPLWKGKLIASADIPHDDWLETRRRGIGGSDVAAIAGLSKFKTPYSLFLEKRGECEPDEVGEQAHLGNELEDWVANKYARETGNRVFPTPGTLQHEEFPWMQVNIDRLVCDDFTHVDCQGCMILECKTTAGKRARDWDDNELPFAALLQVHHTFAVTGFRKAAVPALIGDFGGMKFRIVEVECDDELLARVIEMEAEFWRRVIENDPPPIDGEESTTKMLNRMFIADPDKIIELDDSVSEIIAQRQQAHVALLAAEKRKNEMTNRLKVLMGDAVAGTLADRIVLTYNESPKKGFTVAPTTIRTLRIKESKQ